LGKREYVSVGRREQGMELEINGVAGTNARSWTFSRTSLLLMDIIGSNYSMITCLKARSL
jgi:hypothetical protein